MHNKIFIDEIRSLTQELEAGKSIGGLRLAKIIKKLTELEVEEGGPYSFNPKQGILGANLELNVAVARFLSLQDIRLPKLDAYLAQNATPPDQNTKKAETKEGTGTVSVVYDDREQRMMDLIRRKFEERFAEFTVGVRERACGAMEKTIRGNSDKQMSLMAHYTKVSLGKSGETIPDELVADMGLANIFFWTAFIIYDDFWDVDEAADPKLLPIANVFARHYTDFFSNLLPDNPQFRSFFNTLMDKLDAANAWETEFCRTKVEGNTFHIPKTLPEYGDYEKKYQPASGHILGPIAELVILGYSLESPEIQNVISYFKNYLIAMQLNDDAHDWEEDLRRGHLSTVVDLLIRDLKASGWSKSTIDLVADLPELQKLFWFTTMPKYIKLVLTHTNKARTALDNIEIFEDKKLLMQFVDRNEKIARKAEREQADSIGFLQEYQHAD